MQIKMYRRRTVTLGLAAAALLSAGLARNAGLARAENSTAPTARASASSSAGDRDLAVQTRAHVTRALDRASAAFASLHLTAAQRSHLKALARRDARKVQAIWDDQSLSPASRRQKLLALHSEASGLLTPDQRQREAALRGQAMLSLFESLQWVSKELELDGDQQDQIRSIVADGVHRGLQLRTADGAGKPNFAAIRQLVQSTLSQTNTVLTPAQRTKWAVIQTAARSAVTAKARLLGHSDALHDWSALLQN